MIVWSQVDIACGLWKNKKMSEASAPANVPPTARPCEPELVFDADTNTESISYLGYLYLHPRQRKMGADRYDRFRYRRVFTGPHFTMEKIVAWLYIVCVCVFQAAGRTNATEIG